MTTDNALVTGVDGAVAGNVIPFEKNAAGLFKVCWFVIYLSGVSVFDASPSVHWAPKIFIYLTTVVLHRHGQLSRMCWCRRSVERHM